ncbi:MAG TPA: sugar ABC transporter ATP-binding protein, partial [Agrobacterium sp.]|nr:sugar ABC transporter ATP-binding protein [Agrobacterium sp.]
MATIELNKLVKRYGKVEAVKGIDLAIEDGEFVVFVGPSGCGKSTTLRMIAGLEEISGGTLKIAGNVVNEKEPKQRNIAMVFQ